MNAFALHAATDNARIRWTFSAAVILALHAALIAAGIGWYRDQPPAGTQIPAIMIDMAPASAAPETSQQDVAPGPEMQQADEMAQPPPEPVAQAPLEEQIAPTPPVEKPVVEAPPEQKPEPAPPPEPVPEPEPEPAKVAPEPSKPEPVKPKPVRVDMKKKPSETPPAPRSSAAPRAERIGRAAAVATAGVAAAAAALPSYRDRLNAHLQRYKEPSSTGKQGVATLTFTVSRSGQVLSSRISGSSGTPELDTATLSLIRRAQPLPAFPPEITQSSMSFTVGIRYMNR